MCRAPSTHQSLLLRLKDPKDDEAWEAFVRIYTPLLQHYCRARGLQPADTDDVVQEVLPKVQGFGDRYQSERGRFRDWLRKVTNHEIARYYRKLARPGRGGALDAAWLEQQHADTARVFHDIYISHLVTAAFSRVRAGFDEEKLRAFEMVAFKVCSTDAGQQIVWVEKPPAEVAKCFGRPRAWVDKVKHQIQKRLREEIRLLAEDMPGLLEE